MKIESFSTGSKYYSNEDRLLVKELGSIGTVAVMADGMGGLSLGDVAAEAVTRSVSDYLANNYHGNDEKATLHKSLEFADQELRKLCIEKRSNMGAAIAVAIVTERKVSYTWQGNVRIYLNRDGVTTMLTHDHVADVGYGRTALVRCIKGVGLRPDLPFYERKLQKGDKIYICSDGLYSIVETLLGHASMEEMKEVIGMPDDDASLISLTIR